MKGRTDKLARSTRPRIDVQRQRCESRQMCTPTCAHERDRGLPRTGRRSTHARRARRRRRHRAEEKERKEEKEKRAAVGVALAENRTSGAAPAPSGRLSRVALAAPAPPPPPENCSSAGAEPEERHAGSRRGSTPPAPGSARRHGPYDRVRARIPHPILIPSTLTPSCQFSFLFSSLLRQYCIVFSRSASRPGLPHCLPRLL
eukprot:SAG11_NODE_3428_length_2454_cov_7.726539_1_plen_202_part_00